MNKLFIKLCCTICITLTCNMVAFSEESYTGFSQNLKLFNDVFKTLYINYADTIDAEKSINTAINAMLKELDPYTTLFKNTEDYRQFNTGKYGGVGCTHMVRDSNLYCSGIMEGYPAHKAGLKPGDQIIAIDNDSVGNVNLDEISNKIRGEAGTNVSLTIKRPYTTDSILTLNITRGTIDPIIVPYHGVIYGDIGYIKLDEFKEDSYNLVKKHLLEFKNNPNVKSIIIDLRSNPGGQVNSCVDLISLFMPKNTLVMQSKGKGDIVLDEYKTQKKPVDTEIPLAILINNSSASASEVFSGTIQDYDRGIIVGQRSFGKGLVQSSFKTANDTYLKVTTAKYYLPSGRLIQALDYFHKSPDGKVTIVADSLTSVYKTKNGREVRDGRGITPDVTVEIKDNSKIAIALYYGHHFFDYANYFAATHPSIVAAEDFVITNSIFNDFKNFINVDKIKYDKKCEEMLTSLAKIAEEEGYMTDSIKSHIDALKELLKHDIYKDIDNNRKEIEELLAIEIAERYYFSRGIIGVNIKSDDDIIEAVKILHDPQRYKSILKPQNNKK